MSSFPPLPPGIPDSPSNLSVLPSNLSPTGQPGDLDQASYGTSLDLSSSERISQLARIHVRDFAMPFQVRAIASGTSYRFQLPVNNLDPDVFSVALVDTSVSPNAITVMRGGTDYTIDFRSGVLFMTQAPSMGLLVVSQGEYFKDFQPGEMNVYVRQAYLQHTSGYDTVPQLDVWPVPAAPAPGNYGTPSPPVLAEIEEYPLSLLVTHMALFDLAIQASQEFDIHTPDGVTIPRGQRYRQILEMATVVEQKYKDQCTLMGIGMYRITMGDLRRVSRTTSRYVPVYRAREYDDRAWAQRELLPRDRPSSPARVVSYMGQYNPAAAYNKDNVVDLGGNRYIAIQPVPVGATPAIDVNPSTGYGFYWAVTTVNSGWFGLW